MRPARYGGIPGEAEKHGARAEERAVFPVSYCFVQKKFIDFVQSKPYTYLIA